MMNLQLSRLRAVWPTRRGALVLGAVVLAACSGTNELPPGLSLAPLAAPALGDAAEPFVASTPDGGVTLSWLERQADSSVALRFATLAPGDTSWSAPQEILRRSDLFVNWADFPSLVTLTDGTLLAHWLQRNGTGRYSYDVHLAASTDGGRSWGPSALPHPPGFAAEHGFVAVLPDPAGGADVVLLDGSEGARTRRPGAKEPGAPMQLGVARWQGGTVVSRQIIDDRVCDCCQTALARTVRGLVAVYRDRSADEIRDMGVVRFVDGAWTAPARLHRDDWKIDYCPVNGPAVSTMGDTVAAVWFSAPNDSARVQLLFSIDGGATFGAPIRIDGGQPTGRVDVELLDGDRALVSWVERVGGQDAEVCARIVHRDGTLEPALVVSPSSGTRSSGFPRMARTADGVVIAWTIPGTPSTIRVARLTAAGR
ncbi:MAG: exo-alpha-sialidase [Gemmatimonadaceae bacterium]